jgi:hypothetical protein
VNDPQLKTNPQGRIVDALKRWGGIAALPDLYALIGDDLPRATLRSTLQTFSSDATWERPSNAEDLVYSVNGVGARSGIWGLRGFVPPMPETYPLAELAPSWGLPSSTVQSV